MLSSAKQYFIRSYARSIDRSLTGRDESIKEGCNLDIWDEQQQQKTDILHKKRKISLLKSNIFIFNYILEIVLTFFIS